MTTNSKPTPGEWRRVHDHPDDSCRASIAHIVSTSRCAGDEIATLYQCDIDPEQAANADLIAEAGTVYNETGLTPRQLAEQRAVGIPVAMVSALAAIDEEMGLPKDGCNSTARTLTAIRLLHSAHRDDVAEIAQLTELLACAARKIEGYKRAGWITNPAAGEEASDFLNRARAAIARAEGKP